MLGENKGPNLEKKHLLETHADIF